MKEILSRKTIYDCSGCIYVVKRKCAIGVEVCNEKMKQLGIEPEDYGKYCFKKKNKQ